MLHDRLVGFQLGEWLDELVRVPTDTLLEQRWLKFRRMASAEDAAIRTALEAPTAPEPAPPAAGKGPKRRPEERQG